MPSTTEEWRTPLGVQQKGPSFRGTFSAEVSRMTSAAKRNSDQQNAPLQAVE